MSDSERSSEASGRAAFEALDETVARAVEELERLRTRAEAAESKSRELEEVVRRFTDDEAAGGRLLSRLRSLEEENADLLGRLERGREGVDRLLARIRFLEEQR